MLKKKLSIAVLVASLAFSIVGCGTKEEESAAVAEPQEQQVVEVDKDAIIKEAIVDNFFAPIPDNNNIIAPEKFQELYAASPDSYYVVDIRSEEDFAKGHIEGAVNIPWAKVGEQLAELPEDQTVVFMCVSGQTAGQTVGALRVADMDVLTIKGGSGGWEKAGLPFVQ